MNHLKLRWPTWTRPQRQTQNIVFITFWSQFSSYTFNTIMILFLMRPLMAHGLNYDQGKAYAFIGVSQATGYLVPILGGFMADHVLGLRRAILCGSFLLATAYLLIVLSGLTLQTHGDTLFLMAYALLPASNSLLMGTASGMVSCIYADDALKAKAAMTYYYMAINVGALLATFLAPSLIESPYGPLSVLTVAFIGKAIAALNFAKHYALYDNVVSAHDRAKWSPRKATTLLGYLLVIYVFTLFAYAHIQMANIVISFGCAVGILWFFVKTQQLSGESRSKQRLALALILEAVIFFVIYNQMNTTLVVFAQQNSDLNLLGLHLSPAHYQIINPLLILALGTQLPRFYQRFPRFTIPYQFAAGTVLAGVALLCMAFATTQTATGYVNGNYIGLTYVFISLAELWISAIGLSMIGLYCDHNDLGFAMGMWYLAGALSNTISGQVARFVVIPTTLSSPLKSLLIYQHYYWTMGMVALLLGVVMMLTARKVQNHFRQRGMVIV